MGFNYVNSKFMWEFGVETKVGRLNRPNRTRGLASRVTCSSINEVAFENAEFQTPLFSPKARRVRLVPRLN